MTLNLCTWCGQQFSGYRVGKPACNGCKPKAKREYDRLRVRAYRIRKGVVNVGVGKGGANTKCSSDSQFKTGIRYFKRRRGKLRTERRYCEVCGTDLRNARIGMWAVHHRDHNRKNNVDTNFQLLCKRCHQLEHNCQNNLPKVQRPSSNGVGNSVPEARNILAVTG